MASTQGLMKHALRAAPRDVWVRFNGTCLVHLPAEWEEAIAADTHCTFTVGDMLHMYYLILTKALLSTILQNKQLIY